MKHLEEQKYNVFNYYNSLIMNQNLQYFKGYCELNQLPFDDSRISIAQKIEQCTKPLVSYSRWSYFFESFDEYCREKIDIEAFITMGDGLNDQSISQHPLALQAVQAIQTQLKIREDALQ
jgi:hypothetical protein